jgi:hypothetical protein
MSKRRARHISMRGWLVEEYKNNKWVRIYEGLLKSEARFIAGLEETSIVPVNVFDGKKLNND